MPIGTTGQLIKVVLIVILIILLVIEFFTLFVGLAFVILPGVEKNLVHYGLFMVIAAGLLICLAFVGLCGAVRECYLKLFVFAGLLIAVLLVSLLVHLFMLGDEEDSSSSPKRKKREVPFLRENFENFDNFNSSTWDIIHKKFRCCGLDGPQYWLEKNLTIPFSCCHMKDDSLDPISKYCIDSSHGEYLYRKGCARFKGSLSYMQDEAGSSSSSEEATNITMVTIIRTCGYFIQLAAVVLSIWLGILILLSYHCGYY